MDWEVKEEAIKCLETIIDAFLNSNNNEKNLEDFINKLWSLKIIKALSTCLDDYEPRFLHKSYMVLQKIRKFLVETFNMNELKYNGGANGHEYIQFPNKASSGQSKEYMDLNKADEAKLLTREDIIGDIIDEEKSYLMAKRFKLDNSKINRNTLNGGEENKYAGSDNINDSDPIKDKANKDYCVRQFLQYVTFDIDYRLRLQEYDKYYNKLNSLDSVLDDILSSVSDKNQIDGIDCY